MASLDWYQNAAEKGKHVLPFSFLYALMSGSVRAFPLRSSRRTDASSSTDKVIRPRRRGVWLWRVVGQYGYERESCGDQGGELGGGRGNI